MQRLYFLDSRDTLRKVDKFKAFAEETPPEKRNDNTYIALERDGYIYIYIYIFFLEERIYIYIYIFVYIYLCIYLFICLCVFVLGGLLSKQEVQVLSGAGPSSGGSVYHWPEAPPPLQEGFRV